MVALNFVRDIVAVSLINLLLPQDFGLKLFLVSVGEFLNLFGTLVQQHLAVDYFFFLVGNFFFEL